MINEWTDTYNWLQADINGRTKEKLHSTPWIINLINRSIDESNDTYYRYILSCRIQAQYLIEMKRRRIKEVECEIDNYKDSDWDDFNLTLFRERIENEISDYEERIEWLGGEIDAYYNSNRGNFLPKKMKKRALVEVAKVGDVARMRIKNFYKSFGGSDAHVTEEVEDLIYQLGQWMIHDLGYPEPLAARLAGDMFIHRFKWTPLSKYLDHDTRVRTLQEDGSALVQPHLERLYSDTIFKNPNLIKPFYIGRLGNTFLFSIRAMGLSADGETHLLDFGNIAVSSMGWVADEKYIQFCSRGYVFAKNYILCDGDVQQWEKLYPDNESLTLPYALQSTLDAIEGYFERFGYIGTSPLPRIKTASSSSGSRVVHPRRSHFAFMWVTRQNLNGEEERNLTLFEKFGPWKFRNDETDLHKIYGERQGIKSHLYRVRRSRSGCPEVGKRLQVFESALNDLES